MAQMKQQGPGGGAQLRDAGDRDRAGWVQRPERPTGVAI